MNFGCKLCLKKLPTAPELQSHIQNFHENKKAIIRIYRIGNIKKLLYYIRHLEIEVPDIKYTKEFEKAKSFYKTESKLIETKK